MGILFLFSFSKRFQPNAWFNEQINKPANIQKFKPIKRIHTVHSPYTISMIFVFFDNLKSVHFFSSKVYIFCKVIKLSIELYLIKQK